MEPIESRASQDIVQYISNLELEKPSEAFEIARTRAAVAEELVKDGEEQAFLSDKSVVSFASNVNGQTREDILNSTLLAQLAANKQKPIEDDMKGWYDKYVEVLEHIGWVVEKNEINNYEAKESLVEVENVILDILSATFGANYIVILKKVLESLKKMSENNDGRIKVFEKNTHTMTKGCFQIGLATEENGAVAMQLGTFLLTAKSKITKILFVKIKKDETSLQYATGQATLNKQVYAVARQTILDKLQKDVTDYIAEIDI